jgi:hypothetical protein
LFSVPYYAFALAYNSFGKVAMLFDAGLTPGTKNDAAPSLTPFVWFVEINLNNYAILYGSGSATLLF